MMPDTCRGLPVAAAWQLDYGKCPVGRLGFSSVHEQNKKEDGVDNLWLVLFWTGPIGIGIFLMGLGVLFWGIAQMRNKKE
jgi:hypothetical protein